MQIPSRGGLIENPPKSTTVVHFEAPKARVTGDGTVHCTRVIHGPVPCDPGLGVLHGPPQTSVATATVPASKKKTTPGKGRGHAPQPGQNSPGHLRTRMYTSVNVHTHTYTNVHVRTRRYTYVLVRTRTYTYVLVRTRTYTHVHVRTCPLGFSSAWDPSHPRVGVLFFLLAGWLVELAGLDGSAGWPSLSGNAATVRSINKIITLVILHSCQKMNNITIILIISLILILAVLQ